MEPQYRKRQQLRAPSNKLKLLVLSGNGAGEPPYGREEYWTLSSITVSCQPVAESVGLTALLPPYQRSQCEATLRRYINGRQAELEPQVCLPRERAAFCAFAFSLSQALTSITASVCTGIITCSPDKRSFHYLLNVVRIRTRVCFNIDVPPCLLETVLGGTQSGPWAGSSGSET